MSSDDARRAIGQTEYTRSTTSKKSWEQLTWKQQERWIAKAFKKLRAYLELPAEQRRLHNERETTALLKRNEARVTQVT